MQLLVGLGNPGKQYVNNRHNVGFIAADMIAARHRFSPWVKKFRGFWAEGSAGGGKVFLLKPQTFMNLSGESVAEAARFYKIPVEQIVVIHDELDFEFGTAKLKRAGGNAGHNGLESIEAHLGSNDFLRVRFGIGKGGDTVRHVLSDFSKEEMAAVEPMLEKLAAHLFQTLKTFDALKANNLKLDLAAGEENANPRHPRSARSAEAAKPRTGDPE